MKMKKLAALALAAVMTMGMATTAMAATITIQDTVEDGMYTAYKIFDATVGANGAVSYTIPAGSTIMTVAGFGDIFETQNNGGNTYVKVKDGVKESAVIEFLKTCAKDVALSAVAGTATSTADASTVTITNLDPGYYYVASTVNNGAAVMLASATDTITIHEKNAVPGWGEGGKEANGVTYYVGDTINYTLTYEEALNYNNGEKIYQYVVVDTMPTGIELDTDSIKITVDGEKLEKEWTGTVTEGGFQLTIPWAETRSEVLNGEEDFYYDAPSTIVVTYSATMTSGVTAGVGITNHATINPNTDNSDTGKDDTVYTGALTVNKYDGKDNSKKLAGAQFKIIDTPTVVADTTKYLTYDASTDAYGWSADAEDTKVVVLTTDENGAASKAGLKAGTYYLLETVAPAGYNLMTTPQEFVIAEDNEETTDVNELLVTANVPNNAGTQLPSTGGIGTTIFYVVGGILVLGAGVVLVAKKRMNHEA